jgi:hypothetical protein
MVRMPRALRGVFVEAAEAPAVGEKILNFESLITNRNHIALKPGSINRRESFLVEMLCIDAEDLGANLRSKPVNFDHFKIPAVAGA